MISELPGLSKALFPGSTPIKEGSDCRRRQHSLIPALHGTKCCALCPIKRTLHSALTQVQSSHKCFTGEGNVHHGICEVSYREGTNLKNNQYFYFFLFSKLPFKPREGDSVQVRLKGKRGPQPQLQHNLSDVIAHALYSSQDNFFHPVSSVPLPACLLGYTFCSFFCLHNRT